MASVASNSARWDPLPPDKSSVGSEARSGQARTGTGAEAAGVPTDDNGVAIDLLRLMGQAERISKDYQSRTIQPALATAYRAWNNQHAQGSKYLGTAWHGRSRLFVPKTRSAVRKNLATAAAALFATEDVVNVSAEYEDDDRARATAATMKADMDYRLTRSSLKSGIPWYQISMGSCLDGQLTGIAVSKQFWEYEEVETGKTQPVEVPDLDENGLPKAESFLDPLSGMSGLRPKMKIEQMPIMRVTKDRPMIDLHPIENIGVDPAAPWYNPVQGGRWFYVDYPMGLSDVQAMMRSSNKQGRKIWLDVDAATLLKGREPDEQRGARRVREGGGDRYEDAKAPGELDIVWVRENFLRISGKDYHWWSVGRHAYISIVQETYEAYPELDGERPYVFGVSQLDTHRVFPMSPVTAWQPLQLELNDITNLRQDTLKRSIAPLAIVKRGVGVDIAQVQRRGQPETVLMADNPETDVKFEATPGPTGAAYTETSVNNAMFDELAGVFSTSSVQSNRQLNETVGGMRLMSGAANAVSEFDLRMWIETWVEPALRQTMHLIRRLESDERVLAVAGQKARALADHGHTPTLSDFDEVDVMLRVNAGIGALDPMQKLAKLKVAFEMLAPMIEGMKAQGITPNFKSVVEEVMGSAGFKDGKRFFEFGEPAEEQPPPELLEAIEQLKLDREKMMAEFQETILTLKSEEARNTEDNRTLIQIEQMRGARETVAQLVGAVSDRAGADADRQHQSAMADQDRRHEAQQSGADRNQRIKEILAGVDGAGKAKKPAAKPAAPAQASPGPSTAVGFPDQVSPSTPLMPAEAAMPDPMQMAMVQLMQMMHQVAAQIGAQQQALQALIAQQSAPQELVRDGDGRLVGMRKGGEFHQVVRDVQGRITGSAPLSAQQGAP